MLIPDCPGGCLAPHALPSGSPWTTQWLPRHYPVAPQALPSGFSAITPWLPSGSPATAPWLPRHFPMAPQALPSGSPKQNPMAHQAISHGSANSNNLRLREVLAAALVRFGKVIVIRLFPAFMNNLHLDRLPTDKTVPIWGKKPSSFCG